MNLADEQRTEQGGDKGQGEQYGCRCKGGTFASRSGEPAAQASEPRHGLARGRVHFVNIGSAVGCHEPSLIGRPEINLVLTSGVGPPDGLRI
jgi:hypothetical protein